MFFNLFTFFDVFFTKCKSRDFLRFFALLHTFSWTMLDSAAAASVIVWLLWSEGSTACWICVCVWQRASRDGWEQTASAARVAERAAGRGQPAVLPRRPHPQSQGPLDSTAQVCQGWWPSRGRNDETWSTATDEALPQTSDTAGQAYQAEEGLHYTIGILFYVDDILW